MTVSSFFSCKRALSVSEILDLCHTHGHKVIIAGYGSDNLEFVVNGVDQIEGARGTDLTFCADSLQNDRITRCKAGVIIITERLRGKLPENSIGLISGDPKLTFSMLASVMYPQAILPSCKKQAIPCERKIHPSVNIDGKAGAQIGSAINTRVSLGSGIAIGADSHINSFVTIDDGVTIGRRCRIGPGVSLSCCHIGDDVNIDANSSIGERGFGFVFDGNVRHFPQLGRVIIQDKVSIGSNCTIDRGALGDTVIGEGSIIDNAVHIAHNCAIGRHCAIQGHAGLAGRVRLGDRSIVGGNASLAGGINIGEECYIHGHSCVHHDLPAKSKVAGYPSVDFNIFLRKIAQAKRSSA